MARAITPRDAILQYAQMARATPALAPPTEFRGRHRRLALTLSPTSPRGMRDARHLARDWICHRRVRRHATARRRRRGHRRGDRRALTERRREHCGDSHGAVGMLQMVAPRCGQSGRHLAWARSNEAAVGRGDRARVRE